MEPLLCLAPLGWQDDMLYLSTDLTTTAMCLSVSERTKGSSREMPLSLVWYQDNVKMQFIWRSNSYQHIINIKIQLLSRHNLPAICNFNYQNQIVSQVWLQPFTGGSLEQNTRKFMFKKIINLLRWATQRLCQAGFWGRNIFKSETMEGVRCDSELIYITSNLHHSHSAFHSHMKIICQNTVCE